VYNFFVDGLLIDTGHSNMRKEIFSALSNLPVKQMFISHHHEDHSGNIPILKNHFNSPVYASSKCVKVMKNPPKISFAQWLTWGDRKPNFALEAKDDFIKTPKYHFEIIPIPGHASDMVCLFEKNKGWLFSADLFVNEYIKYFMRPESVSQQISSLKKILQLDFEIMFCSHNPQFKNPKIKLQKKLEFFETFYGNVARLFHKGYSIQQIFKEMKIKESWGIRIMSHGNLSTSNMIKAVIRDEESMHE
jgi:glyoxylase-like metal-dependent hydrolase (beta-lactamase superfamily II)